MTEAQRQTSYHRLGLTYNQFCMMKKDLSSHSIGKYSIKQKIGEGGFGQVYKGINDQTQHQVAVKIIDLREIHNQKHSLVKEIKLRLSKTEDKLMMRCNSPNIVKCLDVYVNMDLKIIMMEYCNRKTLDDYIDEYGKISQNEAILIIKQILNGISELHSKKIIHRDIKADNIFIHNSQFKIGDFGFSKQLRIAEDDAIDKHTTLGTPATMAPEVLAKQPYGLKADIWSVGVIFYQMIFGSIPYPAITKNEILEEIKDSSFLKGITLTINGVTCSKQAFDFLKATLQMDQNLRIGWKQITKHPIFHKQIINSVMVDDIDLVAPSIGCFQSERRKQEEESSEDEIDLLKLPETIVLIRKINQNSAKKNILRTTEEEQSYSYMKQNLFNCLRVELVYHEIICSIERNKHFQQNRSTFSLIYLLSARCLNDLNEMKSGIHRIQCLKRSDVAVKQTIQKIKGLFDELKSKTDKYSQKIYEENDGMMNRITDFFKTSQTMAEKDRFFYGSEKVEFSRNEQIKYTQNKYVKKIMNLESRELKESKLYLLLKQYSRIMLVEPSECKNGDFNQFVDKLFKDEEQS